VDDGGLATLETGGAALAAGAVETAWVDGRAQGPAGSWAQATRASRIEGATTALKCIAAAAYPRAPSWIDLDRDFPYCRAHGEVADLHNAVRDATRRDETNRQKASFRPLPWPVITGSMATL
jgi:hypothetical protein